MKPLTLLLTLSLILIACQQEPEGIVPVSLSEDVTITAEDGLVLVNTFTTPPSVTQPEENRIEERNDFPVPGVLLLHMLGSDRSAWSGFDERLAARGYASLAIDLRGHGETGGEVDWVLAQSDVQTAWEALVTRPEVDPNRTVIIGASIGSNLALIGGANNSAVSGVVLLSPGLDYRGVTTDDAIVGLGSRPGLIIASSNDTYSAQSSQTLHDLAPDTTQLHLFDGGLHGTRLLNQTNLNTEDIILNWLEELRQ